MFVSAPPQLKKDKEIDILQIWDKNFKKFEKSNKLSDLKMKTLSMKLSLC